MTEKHVYTVYGIEVGPNPQHIVKHVKTFTDKASAWAHANELDASPENRPGALGVALFRYRVATTSLDE